MTTETTTVNNTAPDAGVAEAPGTIGLNDIAFLLQIVEICTQRGSFRADELTQVGATYDKVRAFLDAYNKPADAEADAEPAEETE
jgi:hypothetical protein